MTPPDEQLPQPDAKPSARWAWAALTAGGVVAVSVTAAMCTGALVVGVPGEWTWDLKPTGAATDLWFAGGAFGLFLISVLLIARQIEAGPGPRRRWEDVLLLLALVGEGMVLQLGMGQLAKAGLHEWPTIVAVPWANGYFDAAMDVKDIRSFMADYHRLMPQLNFHCRTHPPGAILFFWVPLKVLELWPALTGLLKEALIDSAFDPRELLAWLAQGTDRELTDTQMVAAWVSSVAMAGVCVSGCIPVFLVARHLFGRVAGLWSAATYLVAPCVLYFTPALDQVVASVCAWAGCCWVLALADRPGRARYVLAAAAGVTLAVAGFVSISAGAFGAMLALVWAAELMSRWPRRRELAWLAGAACAGGVGFYVVVYAATGHCCAPTFLRILSVAQENVRQQYIQRPVVFTYPLWLLWNLVEFFLGVGLATGVCFWACGWRSASGRRLWLSFVAALVLLDLSGTSMSETGRLWMCLGVVPIAFAGQFVAMAGRWAPAAGAGLVLLSFGQAVALKLCFGWI